MAKFYGKVGYVDTIEVSDGVFKETVIKEQNYYGDLISNRKRSENGENLNDNINVNNSISILADAYAYNHFFFIKYVEWMGALWKVTDVEVQRPRLILNIGGLYNGITKSDETS